MEVVIEGESGVRGGVLNSPRASSSVRSTLYMSQYSIGGALYCTVLNTPGSASVYTEQFTQQQYRLKRKELQCRGILVKKVICVAPGHKKCRIFVFLSVAHLRFFFKGLLAN